MNLKACLIFCTIVLATFATTESHAQNPNPRWKVGQFETFEIIARFSTTLLRPDRNPEIVDAQIGLTLTTFIKEIFDTNILISTRIEQASYRSVEDSGHAIYALSYHTDPTKIDPELNIELPNVDDMVGKTFEFSLPTNGNEIDLLTPFDEVIRWNFDIKYFRRLVGENMFSRLLRWYFILDLNQQDDSNQWSDSFQFNFRPDGVLHFEPQFTIQNHQDHRANIAIDGFVYYEDNRDPREFVKGLKELKINSQSISGNAVWNTTDQRVQSLSLKTFALMEPKEINPLGLHIQRKLLRQEYSIRRINSDNQ